MGDIAASAGTTEPDLLTRFASKDALIQAVIAEVVLPHLAPGSLDGLRKAAEADHHNLQSWHAALVSARARALSRLPELTRLLLVELLRDEAVRERFATQWHKAAWAPLLQLFNQLQKDGRISRDLPASFLVSLFLSVNLGYLVGRLVLAPHGFEYEASEITAITAFYPRRTSPARH